MHNTHLRVAAWRWRRKPPGSLPHRLGPGGIFETETESCDDRRAHPPSARPPAPVIWLPHPHSWGCAVSRETYRHVVDAKRPYEFGGGLCNVLIRRVNDHIELLFHADLRTGALLSTEQAVEVAQALTTAAKI